MIPAEQQLNMSVADDGAVVVGGEIDVATFAELSAQIRAALEDADTTLVVDLAAVTFMDSSGLRLLLEVKESSTARSIDFIIRDPSAAVRRLLDITGLTEELHIS